MITIIDYGLGNIKAFLNVYKRLNIQVAIAHQKEDLKNVSKIILPGVGAFDHAMNLLKQSGMKESLDELVLGRQIPVIGICVGMQILANSSEEGVLPGLGWIDGVVKKFDVTNLSHKTHLPHMGWNNVVPSTDHFLLNGLSETSRFYFLHSYCFFCNNEKDAIAHSEYGIRFTCAVAHKNIFGVQFHPEKSHHNGVQLLKNFAEI